MARLPPSRDDLDDDLAPSSDPVVRMPRRMYVPPPEPEASNPLGGPRAIAVIAAVGAVLGATLGAVGLGIVWTTLAPLTARPAVTAARPTVSAPPDAAPPPSFALELDASAPSEAPRPNGPTYDVTQERLGGRTLAAALRAMHLTPADGAAAVRALQTLVNMRTLQATDRVAVLRDPVTRELRRVEYRREPAQVWAAVREPEGWHGERVAVTLATRHVAAGFRVTGSLAATLTAAHLEPDLGARLAEVFGAMGLPPRVLAGDVVRLIVDEERANGSFYRYGTVLGIDYRGAYGHRRGFWVGIGTVRGDFFDARGHTFERGPLHSPVPGARLSSLFNPRRMHPVLHVIKAHNGIDFAAPEGTPIYAAADGVIATVGEAGPSGNLVTVTHPTLRVTSGYAHMSRFAPGLRPGMRVHAGQLLGYVGSTGRSTGAHLHFSTKRGGAFVDPLVLMGIRRTIAQGARLMFDAQIAQVGRALDRIAVDGVTLVEGGAPAAPVDAGPPASLPPLEVGATGVESEHDEPEGDGDDPLDEGERAQ